MNIDASGLISLFSGESELNFQAADGEPGGLSTEQFAAALSAQIAALNEAQGMQQTGGGTGGELSLIPGFAALHGKNLPGLGLDKGDIDLNATLDALTEVLKNIDAAHVAGAFSSIDSTSTQINTKSDEMGGLLVDPAVESTGIQVTDQTDSTSVAVVPATLPLGVDQNPVIGIFGSDGSESSKKVVTRSAITTLHAGKSIPQTLLSSVQEQADTDVVKLMQQGLDNFAGKNGNASASGELFNPSRSESLLDGSQTGGDMTGLGSSKAMMDIGGLNQILNNATKSELPAMTLPLLHPDWGSELAEKMVWMHKQSVPSAELNLNPRHLGPISIHVDVNQEQTSIAFTTHSTAVKEAIEASLPRLRELLGTQQLNLVDVNVSQQHSEQKQAGGFFQAGSDQQRQQAQNPELDGESQTAGVASAAEEIEAGRAMISRGILSIFA